MKKAIKYVGKKLKSFRLNQTPHTGNIRNPLTCPIINSAWTSLPTGLSLSQQM
jgi:hypothetical protein